MWVYRCELELMEPTFFASREVSEFYQTEPVIGNYALAYALGFCYSEYHNDGEIHYRRDLGELNQRGIYVTPATILGKPKFTFSQFNALSDSYWYEMAQNVVFTDRRRVFDRSINPRATNFPQVGKLKMLAIGNRAVFFVISRREINIPRYIRLGKWMSKAKVRSLLEKPKYIEGERRVVKWTLNPNDLPEKVEMFTFDLINLRPTPLIRNAEIQGDLYLFEDESYLPAGMKFGLP